MERPPTIDPAVRNAPARDKGRARRHVLLVLAVALAARLGLALALNPHDIYFSDRHYVEYARHFAEGQGFWGANPYGPAGPERVYAFRPPLFPFVWGLLWNVTGGAYTPMRLGFAVLSSVGCALVYAIGRRLFPDPRVALLGALGTALYPPLVWHGVQLMTEPFFIFFSILTVFFLLRAAQEDRRLDALAAGAACALGILSRSSLAAFAPLGGLWLLWAAQGPWRRRWTLFALYAAAGVAVMAPWIIRNAVVLHAFVPTTTDSAHGFAIANNEGALGDPRGFYMYHPEEWNFVLKPGEERLGEIEIQGRIYRRTYDGLFRHPGLWARLLTDRFVRFWRFWPHAEFTGRGTAVLYAVSYIPVFLLLWPGIFLAHRDLPAKRRGFALIYLLSLVTMLLYTYYMATLRYREPLMPFFLLFAAYAVLRLVRRRVVPDTALLNEGALGEDWNRPEEDDAWARLQSGR